MIDSATGIDEILTSLICVVHGCIGAVEAETYFLVLRNFHFGGGTLGAKAICIDWYPQILCLYKVSSHC